MVSGMMSRSLEDVVYRLESVFGPWSHVDEDHQWDLRREEISLVRVYGISGSISVQGVTGDRASLHVRKVIHSPQVGAAEAFASRVRVRFNVRNRRLYVRVLHPRPPLGGRVFVHLTLRVPHAVDVALRASRGSLSLRGVEGAVQANTRTGNITVRDGLGPVALETGDGIVDVGDVEGSVDLRCGRGLIRLDTITGRVKLRANQADVTATEIRGQLDAQVRRGAIKLEGGAGIVKLQTGDGDVQAAFAAGHRDVGVTSRRGDVALSLGAVEGEVRAESSQGDIALSLNPAFSGRVEAVTRAGRVSTSRLGGAVPVHIDRLDVNVGGTSAAHVWAASVDGDIDVVGRREGEEEGG